MEITLAQKAISLALHGNWKEAADVNLQILKESPDDTDALNRLARSYSELGKIKEARQTSKKVLDLDPVNTIALKCQEKWKSLNHSTQKSPVSISSESFLEEPGKTKIIPLMNLGQEKIISSLDPGEEVKLNTHTHRVSVTTRDEHYVGVLPDDVAARLKNLIKNGNKYQVLVKSADPKEVAVFIRETERGKNVSTSSFPAEKIEYVTFTPPELVHKDQTGLNTSEDFSQIEA